MTTWLFDPSTDDASARDVLDITMRFEGDVTLCVLDGPVCAYTAPSLDEWLAQLHDNGRHRVIVDASHVGSLSTDAVEVLVDHARRCEDAGGQLQVRSPSSGAERVLQLCDALHLVERTPGVDAAGR